MRLYLASTSPARLALLRAAGIDPIVIPSAVDEDAALAAHAADRGVAVDDLGPAEVVETLARAKALAVADGASDPRDEGAPLDGLVLGGDSMFEFDGRVLGKPHATDVARERWRAQRGRTGVLWSGQWLVDRRAGAADAAADAAPARAPAPVRSPESGETPEAARVTGSSGPAGEGLGAVAHASVTFVDDLSDAELEAYLASGEPLEVAGAFTIDSLGAAYIERIEGDPSTVVGLSIPTLRRLVRALGVEWHELWTHPEEAEADAHAIAEVADAAGRRADA